MKKVSWLGLFCFSFCRPSGAGSCLHRLKQEAKTWFYFGFLEFSEKNLALEQMSGEEESLYLQPILMNLRGESSQIDFWFHPLGLPFNRFESVFLRFPTKEGFARKTFDWPSLSAFQRFLEFLEGKVSVGKNMKAFLGQLFHPQLSLASESGCFQKKKEEGELCAQLGELVSFSGKLDENLMLQLRSFLNPIRKTSFWDLTQILFLKGELQLQISQQEVFQVFQRCWREGSQESLCLVIKDLEPWEKAIEAFLRSEGWWFRDKFEEPKKALEEKSHLLFSQLSQSQKKNWFLDVMETHPFERKLHSLHQWEQSQLVRFRQEKDFFFYQGPWSQAFLVDEEKAWPLAFFQKRNQDESGGIVMEPLPYSDSNDLVPPPPSSCP